MSNISQAFCCHSPLSTAFSFFRFYRRRFGEKDNTFTVQLYCFGMFEFGFVVDGKMSCDIAKKSNLTNGFRQTMVAKQEYELHLIAIAIVLGPWKTTWSVLNGRYNKNLKVI